MKFFYNIVYLLLLLASSPWILWRILFQGKNRDGWNQKLFGIVPVAPPSSSDKRCVWIHAVSVGEVNLLPKLVNQLKQDCSNLRFAISTTTQTGLQLAQSKFPGEQVFYCPADFSWAVNNALDRIAPDMMLLTELELWPNLISLTAERNIPVALINGRISEQSFKGYRRFRFIAANILSRLNSALVQTNDYRDRLIELGMSPENISVTGNIKFDNAFSAPDPGAKQTIQELANFDEDDFVFVAGSTLEVEDRLLLEIFAELRSQHPALKLVLVPRHPERVPRLENFVQEHKLRYSLRSNLDSGSVRNQEDEILIVNVIGELALWWQMADAGFVGGSMGQRGGQNMIEPAALGIPICFGPDTRNFKDVVQLLLAHQGARRVHDQSELQQFIEWAISETDQATLMGRRAHEITMKQRGALKQTIDALVEILDAQSQSEVETDSRSAA